TGEFDRLFRNEDGIARLVSEIRTGIDAPGGLVFAVDREFDRPGNAVLLPLIIVDLIEVSFGQVDVRSRFDELDLDGFVGRRSGGGFDFEFGESAGSEDGTAGPAKREVGIV